MILLKLPFHLLSAITFPFYLFGKTVKHYRLCEKREFWDCDKEILTNSTI